MNDEADDDDSRDSSSSMEEEGNNNSDNKLIPEGMLPSYLASAFGELYQEDGLVVLGKGLGWLNLMGCFVRFYADVEHGHVALLKEETAAAEDEDDAGNENKRSKKQPALEDEHREGMSVFPYNILIHMP
jgi:hypothetical protein